MTFEVLNVGPDDISSFDLLVYAVGYESRSSYVAERYSSLSRVGVGYYFSLSGSFSFLQNDQRRVQRGHGRLSANESLVEHLKVHHPNHSFVKSRILFDVSSLSRTSLAILLSELLDDPFFDNADICIVYAVAEFQEPGNAEAVFVDFAPLDRFEGWTSHPELPAVLMLGLGYETDHAVGAVESLDPSSTFCFFPSGNDPRFAEKVNSANKPLLDIVNSDRIIHYPVLAPYQTYWEMHSLMHTLRHVARIVLVPMGPKIFSSLCLVCQRIFGDEVSVWRASGHQIEDARDAFAQGSVVGYTVRRTS